MPVLIVLDIPNSITSTVSDYPIVWIVCVMSVSLLLCAQLIQVRQYANLREIVDNSRYQEATNYISRPWQKGTRPR